MAFIINNCLFLWYSEVPVGLTGQHRRLGPLTGLAGVWASAGHRCFKTHPWILATLSGPVVVSCPSSDHCFRPGGAVSPSTGTRSLTGLSAHQILG